MAPEPRGSHTLPVPAIMFATPPLQKPEESPMPRFFLLIAAVASLMMLDVASAAEPAGMSALTAKDSPLAKGGLMKMFSRCFLC